MSESGDQSTPTPEELAQRVQDLEAWSEQLSDRMRSLTEFADPPGGRKPPPTTLEEVIRLVQDLAEVPRFRRRG